MSERPSSNRRSLFSSVGTRLARTTTGAVAVAFGLVLLVLGATAATSTATTTSSAQVIATTCDYDLGLNKPPPRGDGSQGTPWVASAHSEHRYDLATHLVRTSARHPDFRSAPQTQGGGCDQPVAVIGGNLHRVTFAALTLREEGYSPIIGPQWQDQTGTTGTNIEVSIAFVKVMMAVNRRFIDIGYPRGKQVERFENYVAEIDTIRAAGYSNIEERDVLGDNPEWIP